MINILEFLQNLNYQAWCLKGGPTEVENYKLELIVERFNKKYDNFERLDHQKFLNRYEWKIGLYKNGKWYLDRIDKSKCEGPQRYDLGDQLIKVFEWLMEVR